VVQIRDHVTADPSKAFFVGMLTRDIGVSDCILDLIDNAVDKAADQSKLDVMQRLTTESPPTIDFDARIEVRFTQSEFEIRDNCGGFSRSDAENEVFLFGYEETKGFSAGLSVYGIGMKRAVFKLGQRAVVHSQSDGDSFDVEVDVSHWIGEPKWEFPIQDVAAIPQLGTRGGTLVRVTDLASSVRDRFADPGYSNELTAAIGATYGLFLRAGIRIFINGRPVGPELPTFASQSVLARKLSRFDGVDILTIVGVAPQSDDSLHGWYVFCNGRMVVKADRTELTGWGSGLPQFHAGKHRRFLGYLYFRSSDVDALPWRTTKQGLNTESPVYRAGLEQIKVQSRPVLNFLNDMYPSDVSADVVVERQTLGKALTIGLEDIARVDSTFTYAQPSRGPTTDQSIQFRRPKAEIAAVREFLGDRTMSAARVGEHCFDYFLDEVVE
jgi:hypothetical protein